MSNKPPTEHDRNAAAPDAADGMSHEAIREFLKATEPNWNIYGRRIIKQLLAAVEAGTARIGALERENARLGHLARDLCRQLDDEGCMPESCKELEPVHVYDDHD